MADIMQMLQSLMGRGSGGAAPPVDPRIQAMQQMQSAQQPMGQPQSQSQPQPQPPMPNTDRGTPQTDEQMLDTVHRSMGDGGDTMAGKPKPEDVPQDQWPDTYEGFQKMFGRPPSTDTEVEFYSDDPGAQDDQNETTGKRMR